MAVSKLIIKKVHGMALSRWRVYGALGLIFAYVFGVFVLSAININTRNPQATFSGSMGGFEEIKRQQKRELNSLNKRQQIRWCFPLRFLNVSKIAPKDNLIPHQTSPPNSSVKPVIHNRCMNCGITALASFPGSGNTWLRYLLQQATGVLTGSIYKDYGLLRSGFPGENVYNQSVLVVKTHEWGPKAWVGFDKAILLVRDPERAILAEFNRQSGGHIGFASPDKYKRTKGQYWRKFVANKLNGWEKMNFAWAKNFTGRLKIVYYDDLVTDLEAVLREILRFLNHSVDEELLSCAITHQEGIYKRKTRTLPFDPFSSSMREYIKQRKLKVYSELGRRF